MSSLLLSAVPYDLLTNTADLTGDQQVEARQRRPRRGGGGGGGSLERDWRRKAITIVAHSAGPMTQPQPGCLRARQTATEPVMISAKSRNVSSAASMRCPVTPSAYALRRSDAPLGSRDRGAVHANIRAS